ERELPVPELETGLGVLGRLAGLLAGLEAWVLRALVEKRRERTLKVPERLLQRHRRHLGQERQLFGLLPRGQHRRSLVVIHPSLFGEPRPRPGVQGEVVDLTDTAERAQQLLSLRIGRIEAVLVRPLHLRPSHVSQTIKLVCKRCVMGVTAGRLTDYLTCFLPTDKSGGYSLLLMMSSSSAPSSVRSSSVDPGSGTGVPASAADTRRVRSSASSTPSASWTAAMMSRSDSAASSAASRFSRATAARTRWVSAAD